MTDRTEALLDALAHVEVPLTWDDVEGRVPALVSPAAPPPGRQRRTTLLAIAAAVVIVVGFAVATTRDHDPARPLQTVSTTAAAITTVPDRTTTTLLATGTYRNNAVEAWTGTEYLVWSGQSGDDARIRADGWSFDPRTGVDSIIPTGPLGPRDSAGGVWSGTELIVCCGTSVGAPGYETANAAAYDPAARTWRRLADPPPDAEGYVIGAVWDGTEMLVAVSPNRVGNDGTELSLLAYDPATDRWDQRASLADNDRVGTVVSAGDDLIVWLVGAYRQPYRDRGWYYDKREDTWTPLPNFPGGVDPISFASAVWADDELLVWGTGEAEGDLSDEYRTARPVGFRWRPGDARWTPMAAAPVEPVRWFEGTPGSQAMGVDPATGSVWAVGLHPDDGDRGGPRDLLRYDPATDRWTLVGGAKPPGYERNLLIGDGRVLVPDVEEPISYALPRR